MKLQGRVAIVTGSASGMGRAGAMLFANEGARVVVADINAPGGQETEKLIREAGGEAHFVSTDVSKPHQVEAMVNEAVERYHGLDILWNNAAATKLCN
jgi:NAD(P)-dependent dehydrogenase (short-subunit alcohol dehydrogenase family)